MEPQKMIRRLSLAAAIAAIVAAGPAPDANACTAFRVTASDGAVLYARTMEFGVDMKSNLMIIPRGHKFTGVTASGKAEGMEWTTKYASVGANSGNQPIYTDGMNEKGLAGGALYFPGFAEYAEVGPADSGAAMASWQLLAWILGNFATVDEVKAALPQVKVNKAIWPDWGMTPPAHFIIHDAGGRSLVVEYVRGGQLTIYDNPLGVLTNAPSFDWHMTNVRNYIGLKAFNQHPVEMSGVKFTSIGQGSGMLGLPGDGTPPSRFIQAVAYSQSMIPAKTADEAVKYAFHTLNKFDISYGASRGVDDGKTVVEWTQFSAVSDLKNRRYYVRTFDNNQIYMVDLKEEDLNARELKFLSLNRPETYVKLSARVTQTD
jgi:choloylglycine hydrolase